MFARPPEKVSEPFRSLRAQLSRRLRAMRQGHLGLH